MQHPELLLRFGIALLIGILIGLEREFSRQKEEGKAFAGIRTFPLIALLGCSAALITELTDAGAFAVVALLVGSLIAIAYAFAAREGRVGVTSEVAAMVVFICGALCYWNHLELAASLFSLGVIRAMDGDLAAAEPIFERVLAIREAHLPPRDADIATAINALVVKRR